MLHRVLEPEAMDTAQEAHDYDAMDHTAVNACFVADFLAVHGPCRGGEILDLGTGTAWIPIVLCQADPNARVLASDSSAPMLECARRNIADAGLDGRIRAFQGDAKHLARPDGAFEGVISNSIIHHVPSPGPVLREMIRLVIPGGTVFVRDLARPADLAQLHHLVQTYAGAETDSARALFQASLHAALTLEEVQALVCAAGLSADQVAMTSDRHWTWACRKPI